jgi:hypothetical protein
MNAKSANRIFTTGKQTAKRDLQTDDRIGRTGHKAEITEHIAERGPPTEDQTVEPGPLTAEHKGETEPQTGETGMRSREAETHAGTITGMTVEVGITLEGVHQAQIGVK